MGELRQGGRQSVEQRSDIFVLFNFYFPQQHQVIPVIDYLSSFSNSLDISTSCHDIGER